MLACAVASCGRVMLACAVAAQTCPIDRSILRRREWTGIARGSRLQPMGEGEGMGRQCRKEGDVNAPPSTKILRSRAMPVWNSV